MAASDAFADTAANLHVALDYRTDVAVHDCPTPDELTLNVAKQLGYSPFAEDAEQRLRIELTRVGEHIEAKIQWIDAQGRSQGERQLRSESSDCAEMAQSLSFAVAVQIQLHASETLAQATPEDKMKLIRGEQAGGKLPGHLPPTEVGEAADGE